MHTLTRECHTSRKDEEADKKLWHYKCDFCQDWWQQHQLSNEEDKAERVNDWSFQLFLSSQVTKMSLEHFCLSSDEVTALVWQRMADSALSRHGQSDLFHCGSSLAPVGHWVFGYNGLWLFQKVHQACLGLVCQPWRYWHFGLHNSVLIGLSCALQDLYPLPPGCSSTLFPQVLTAKNFSKYGQTSLQGQVGRGVGTPVLLQFQKHWLIQIVWFTADGVYSGFNSKILKIHSNIPTLKLKIASLAI